MPDFELALLLLVAVAAIVTVARKVGVPFPILLVIGGLALALIPGIPHLELEPELVLVIFLPPLILSAAWQTPVRDLRRNIRPVLALSVGLVLFTTLVVGLVAVVANPGLSLTTAFLLGAIVSPTDALAATTVLRRLGVPRRIVSILEEESLVNDATALTLYRTALFAIASGVFVAGDAVLAFILATVGGILVGLAVALIVDFIWSHLFDPPVEVTLSLLIPYAAFLPAERIGASGVIAAVTAGLYLGYRSSRILTSDARVLANAVWEILIFVLNGLAFMLIGLQLPTVLAGLGSRPVGELLTQAAIISLAVIGARFVWIFGALYVPTFVRRFTRHQRRRAVPFSLPLVASWAGLRGAVSLAAALAVPRALAERDLIIFLTFAVILVTLVGQGLTLPFLLRRLGLTDGGESVRDETRARRAATDAALAELAQLRDRWQDHIPLIENLEERYRHRVEHLPMSPGADTESDQERLEHRAILSAVINAERETVIGLRDRGVIHDEILRRLERELDLEELRLEADL